MAFFQEKGKPTKDMNDLSVAVEEDGGTTQTTDDSDEKIAGSMLLDENSQKIVEFRGLNKF